MSVKAIIQTRVEVQEFFKSRIYPVRYEQVTMTVHRLAVGRFTAVNYLSDVTTTSCIAQQHASMNTATAVEVVTGGASSVEAILLSIPQIFCIYQGFLALRISSVNPVL